ncbi:hypothetical protein [Vibrio galatheae]|uniref:hypothetical protein n=1 Tax=Vibrio galatheae TaxID=579748 RepID=UPI000A3E76EA|nr:hypothetical protein [Vibrio galatheae]
MFKTRMLYVGGMLLLSVNAVSANTKIVAAVDEYPPFVSNVHFAANTNKTPTHPCVGY